jgi:hypothetical protein
MNERPSVYVSTSSNHVLISQINTFAINLTLDRTNKQQTNKQQQFMNLVGGTTDMIHGLSGLFAYLIDRVARVGVHDAALRPVHMTLVVIRDVSGAVADASARLSTDFLDQTHVNVRVRSPRVLAPNGALLVHGPARDPREGQPRRENKAVSKLVRWYRHVASIDERRGNEWNGELYAEKRAAA